MARQCAARLAFLVGLALPEPATARECSYWSANGPGVYNLKNGLTDYYVQQVELAGLGGLRLAFRIDTQQTWDSALFAQYDLYLAKAREHKLDILAIVLYESTTLGQTVWNDDPNDDGANPYVQVFVNTAKTLMDRYGDQIKYWEIWNEPNCYEKSSYRRDPKHAGCYYILPRVYSKLLAETFVQAQATIKTKGLHLVAGGLFAHDIDGVFQPSADYMKEVYEQGPWDWMLSSHGRRYPWDKFAYHLYIDQGSATSMTHVQQYLDAIQALKKQYQDGSPIWMTEFGWTTNNVSEQQQAGNLDTALKLFESRPDVERTFMFKVDDYDGWGLFHSDWTPKPAVGMFKSHTAGCTVVPDAPADRGATDVSDDGPLSDVGASASDGSPRFDVSSTPQKPRGCGCRIGEGGRPSPWAAVALLLLTAAVYCECLVRARSRRL